MEPDFTFVGDVDAFVMRAPVVVYDAICLDRHGAVKWQDTAHNLVTDAGKKYLLDTFFAAGVSVSSTEAMKVGLKNVGAIANADTAASHAGWTEFTSYTDTTRRAVPFGISASGSGTVTKSLGAVTFLISAGGVIAGAFLITNSTKGGTTGTLYSVGDFTNSRTVVNTDVLTVTPRLVLT